MTRASILNDALVTINNAEARGHRQVLIRPSSKVLVKYLSVMQRHGTFSDLSSLRVDAENTFMYFFLHL